MSTLWVVALLGVDETFPGRRHGINGRAKSLIHFLRHDVILSRRMYSIVLF